MKNFSFEVESLELNRPKVIECRGLFFRGYHNLYHQSAEVHLKQGFRFLKSKSCTGCSQCDHFSDQMADQLESNCVVTPDEIKHGGLYQLKVTNIEVDRDSGYADAWDFEFCEVKE